MGDEWGIERMDRRGIQKAPAGLYLTRGDGVAVPVTDAMIDRAIAKARKFVSAAACVGTFKHSIEAETHQSEEHSDD